MSCSSEGGKTPPTLAELIINDFDSEELHLWKTNEAISTITPSPYSTTNCLQLGDYFFYSVWQSTRSKCQERTGTDFWLFSLTTAVYAHSERHAVLCAFLKLMMRAEPRWEAGEWLMPYYSESPCGWIVLHSVPEMGSRQASFGQHRSLISRNRSLKKQTSNLQSFGNNTKFMLRALLGKVVMRHLTQDIQSKHKRNLFIKRQDVFEAHSGGFFAVTSDLLDQTRCIM